MDISDLHENIVEKYYTSSFSTVEVQYHLESLMEHRIKLVLKHTAVFYAGESQNVETSCILDNKQIKLSLTLNPFLFHFFIN